MPWWRRTPRSNARRVAAAPSPPPDEDLDHLPDWLCRLAPTSPGIVHTGDVLDRLLRAVPTSALSRLDVGVRSWSRWDDDGWRRIAPEEVTKLIDRTGRPLAVGAATSLHRNGHVREAAVKVLAGLGDGSELRWLVLRSLDWVDQVATLAEREVRRRFESQADVTRYAASIVDLLPLVDSERFTRTTNVVRLRDDLRRVALGPICREGLWASSRDPDRGLRRAAVRLLADHGGDPLRLLRDQLDGDDIVAAVVAARAGLADDSICAEAALALYRSPIARLRELSLWHLVSHGHEHSSEVDAGLVDRAARVRDVAQRALEHRGTEPGNWYRARLTEDPEGALLGLGDVGTASDAANALSLVGDLKRVAAAAVRLAGRKGGREHLPQLIDLAFDERGAVAREAVLGIRRHGVSDDVATAVFSKAQTSTSPARGRVLVRVLTQAGRWTKVELGLRIALSDDEELRVLGESLLLRTLASWNRSAAAPSASQLESIRTLLVTKNNVRAAIRSELADIVSHW
ncbi:MAG TPA: hypothetical protein VM143_14195 [Acidimicrobiales bacterium]|nr:hypothetical protein [Acidimicrobiales bacterium]